MVDIYVVPFFKFVLCRYVRKTHDFAFVDDGPVVLYRINPWKTPI